MQINDLNLKKKCSIEEIKRWIGIGSEVEVKRIEEVTSSAETEISLAFSSASWRMNLTICWICLETSASFIFTVTERRQEKIEGETTSAELRDLRRSGLALVVWMIRCGNTAGPNYAPSFLASQHYQSVTYIPESFIYFHCKNVNLPPLL